MNLSLARKIKQQLIRYEGRKDHEGFPFIWKILICPEGMLDSVLRGCKPRFNHDEIFAEYYASCNFEIYIIGRADGKEFSCESLARFIERHQIGIDMDA